MKDKKPVKKVKHIPDFVFDPDTAERHCNMIIDSVHKYLRQYPVHTDKVILAHLMAALHLLRVRGVQPDIVSHIVDELNGLLVDDYDPAQGLH